MPINEELVVSPALKGWCSEGLDGSSSESLDGSSSERLDGWCSEGLDGSSSESLDGSSSDNLAVRSPGASAPGTPDGASLVPASLCAQCRRSPGVITLARAIGPHEGALREIVHALKYGGLTSIAAPLAAAMRGCGSDVLAGADAVVPVPLHPRREWQRGFNQAEALSAHLSLPVWRVLARRRPTRAQASLHAADRRRNVERAFALAPWPAARGLAAWANLVAQVPATRTARGIAGRVLVLVDDVSTTGATLEACARVLVAEGAREVRALTAARAVLAPR